MKHKTKKTTKT